jgi:hypothetical protein
MVENKFFMFPGILTYSKSDKFLLIFNSIEYIFICETSHINAIFKHQERRMG